MKKFQIIYVKKGPWLAFIKINLALGFTTCSQR